MEDTIAAIGTPYGEGGIGIVRISGPKSREILGDIFSSASDENDDLAHRKLCYGHILDPENGNVIDEVLSVYMPAPHTYTGDDVVEIDCHGGIVPLRKVLDLVLRLGARMAEPGEFTKNAFLNGRIDLTQAEAVMDVVKAKADRSFDVAMDQLSGSVSSAIQDIRANIMDILVDLTVNIDYPDEDIEVVTYEKLENDLLKVKADIEDLIETSKTGRLVSEGLKVAIIGKPNVGKSSLMNALLREARAIVTDIPGTTRDTIEESLSIKGIPVILTDTAGIRDTEDKIESIGIERSKASSNAADLTVFMIDASRELGEEDFEIARNVEPGQTLVVVNKNDLPSKTTGADAVSMLFPEETVIGVVETTLADGKGTREIEDKIFESVMSGNAESKESVVITSARHADLLRRAYSSIEDAIKITGDREPIEVIEIDVNNAYETLGEIVGESVSDDILDEVFSRFCLGK